MSLGKHSEEKDYETKNKKKGRGDVHATTLLRAAAAKMKDDRKSKTSEILGSYAA